MSDPKPPILIAGSTASGKSALALRIAERCGGAIINADALQVYAGWQVLTARPDAADCARAPHHLYGHVPDTVAYSVGDWLRDLAALLPTLDARPIIVGGTGLYLSALTEGLAPIPPIGPEVRQRGDALRAQGREALRAALADKDPGILAALDPMNPARLQRAWEVITATGRSLSDWQAETGPALLPRAGVRALLLTSEKSWLNPRIDARFDLMLEHGAIAEAAAHLETWDPALPSSRGLGAPELIAHLRGEIPLEEARRRATIATHRFAKRQRTWFRRRMADWQQVPLPEGLSDAQIEAL